MARAAVLLALFFLLSGCAKTSVTVLPGGHVIGAGRMMGSAQFATTAVMDAMKKACEPGLLKMWNGTEENGVAQSHGMPQSVIEAVARRGELQQIVDVVETARFLLPSHAVSLHGHCVPVAHCESSDCTKQYRTP